MCIESKSCLCHRIKDSIITDEKKVFFSFFKQRNMIELYSFLKDSYRVAGSKKFDSRLQSIVLTYLTPNEGDAGNLVINVNQEVFKKKFLSTYKKYQKHQRDKTEVLDRFEKLIHDVEKLTYNNLEENADFMTHLQTKKLKRSSSLRLPRFLHKKSPSSDRQAQESQAESSSPPAPSN
ncbi:hypothetical protein [Legionella rowbothamii]|uniref:hypothetical protein n=1 Tax=Legionella rowbothamii TaxID=96229 RepID=UPI00105420C7|nr:hypothetical protein [Legionella rowbothamii]